MGTKIQMVVMECNIVHHENNITVDVYWYMGDKLIKEQVGANGIPYEELPATLHEDDWYPENALDTEVNYKKYVCILLNT